MQAKTEAVCLAGFGFPEDSYYFPGPNHRWCFWPGHWSQTGLSKIVQGALGFYRIGPKKDLGPSLDFDNSLYPFHSLLEPAPAWF